MSDVKSLLKLVDVMSKKQKVFYTQGYQTNRLQTQAHNAATKIQRFIKEKIGSKNTTPPSYVKWADRVVSPPTIIRRHRDPILTARQRKWEKQPREDEEDFRTRKYRIIERRPFIPGPLHFVRRNIILPEPIPKRKSPRSNFKLKRKVNNITTL